MSPRNVYEPLATDEFELASENEGSVVYTINTVGMDDAGSYMCRAENAVGFHEKELRVQGELMNPFITIDDLSRQHTYPLLITIGDFSRPRSPHTHSTSLGVSWPAFITAVFFSFFAVHMDGKTDPLCC